ncbi:hypothetical protein NL676_007994 [Syzygium grande]|nr:hypothetical protein NL676_007994 [Syzygium grande]
MAFIFPMQNEHRRIWTVNTEANQRVSPATIATFTRPLLGIGRLMMLLAISPPPTPLIVDLLEPARPSVLSPVLFASALLS